MRSIISMTDYNEDKYKLHELIDAINSIEFMEELDEEVISSDDLIRQRHEEEISVIQEIRSLISPKQ